MERQVLLNARFWGLRTPCSRTQSQDTGINGRTLFNYIRLQTTLNDYSTDSCSMRAHICPKARHGHFSLFR